MEIQALGYLGVGTARLDDWTSLATGGLGMQAVDRGAGIRAFRMDDRRQRLVLDSTMPDSTRYFGWEVANAEALDALAARLERAGVAVRQEPAALADQRFVSGVISFLDPAGNRLEAFHGAAVADTPFSPGRLISGFRAGPLGMGHVLVMVQDMTTALAFYRDLLGFRISDYTSAPVSACFLHVNPRHHSIALVEAPVNGMHHLMVELYSFDDVGQGYDLALMSREQIVATLGRHNNDFMTSFYMRTPSDFLSSMGGAAATSMTPPGSRRNCQALPVSGGMTDCSAPSAVRSRRPSICGLVHRSKRCAHRCKCWMATTSA